MLLTLPILQDGVHGRRFGGIMQQVEFKQLPPPVWYSIVTAIESAPRAYVGVAINVRDRISVAVGCIIYPQVTVGTAYG